MYPIDSRLVGRTGSHHRFPTVNLRRLFQTGSRRHPCPTGKPLQLRQGNLRLVLVLPQRGPVPAPLGVAAAAPWAVAVVVLWEVAEVVPWAAVDEDRLIEF